MVSKGRKSNLSFKITYNLISTAFKTLASLLIITTAEQGGSVYNHCAYLGAHFLIGLWADQWVLSSQPPPPPLSHPFQGSFLPQIIQRLTLGSSVSLGFTHADVSLEKLPVAAGQLRFVTQLITDANIS